VVGINRDKEYDVDEEDNMALDTTSGWSEARAWKFENLALDIGHFMT
jgi:hypothetical protein